MSIECIIIIVPFFIQVAYVFSFAQLLDMVGTLIERPIICSDFNHKYPVLVQWCDEELDQAKSIYDRQLALMNTPQGTNM